MMAFLLVSCGRSGAQTDDDGDTVDFDSLPMESVISKSDSVAPRDTLPDWIPADVNTTNEQIEYMRDCEDSDKYMSGILPTVAREVPEYAEKLLKNVYDKFIVVDKARMLVILYDRYGRELRSYKMACGKNYGNKHKRADSRTPEGFFSIEGIYDSSDWLFTDDDGNTSDKKGQFGPRFIRLKIPTTSQIGIHGTSAPWSLGGRRSHGCIRIQNENILELVDLVEPGMPVIVLPGKRDRAVNRQEHSETAYFPTSARYAVSSTESSGTSESSEHRAETQHAASHQPEDSVVSEGAENENIPVTTPANVNETDSI